ncbi:MAG: TPM domain-containing protein [Lachnospiraceae bacterium]|nr:TPM domain-containing protein [Lachnospiraceae bacterium]
MKKKILSVICAALILMFSLQIPAGEVFADLDTSDVYDDSGFLSYGEEEEVEELYDSLWAETGIQFVFLTTEKDLPSKDTISTDFPFLNVYLEDTTPCILLQISSLSKTAKVSGYNTDLSDEELNTLLSTMVSSLNEGRYKEAACETAIVAAEMIQPEFDPVAYRDWILGEDAQPANNTNTSYPTANAYNGRHIDDREGLLSQSEAERLEKLFAEKSEELGVDIIFLTENYFSDYADSACEHLGAVCREKGYGYGEERYVIMFAISVSNRYAMAYEWSANIEKYHRYLQVELDDIFDAVKPNLSTGMNNRNSYSLDRSQAAFATAATTFLEYAEKHADFDEAPYEAFQYSDNYERYDLDGHRTILWGRFGLFGVIGAAVSGIATAICASKHKPKTVTDPEVYSNRNQFAILEQSDQFRVRTTTRVRMSSSSGGGGGHSHGGGGGGGGHGSGGHF